MFHPQPWGRGDQCPAELVRMSGTQRPTRSQCCSIRLGLSHPTASGDDKPPLEAESRQGSSSLAPRWVYEEIFSSTRNSPRIRAPGFKRSCRAREPRAGVAAAEKGMLHIINSCSLAAHLFQTAAREGCACSGLAILGERDLKLTHYYCSPKRCLFLLCLFKVESKTR